MMTMLRRVRALRGGGDRPPSQQGARQQSSAPLRWQSLARWPRGSQRLARWQRVARWQSLARWPGAPGSPSPAAPLSSNPAAG